MKEIFATFFRLGLTSFGGPVAHIGYFHRTCVEDKQWLTDEEFGDLVALSQSLPGPASSQVGIALGYKKAGWLGALTSWTAFTLPSAIAMIVFAIGLEAISTDTLGAVIRGFTLLATIVVANALLGMARKFCVTPLTIGLALAALLYSLLVVFPLSHIVLIVAALSIGALVSTVGETDKPTDALADSSTTATSEQKQTAVAKSRGKTAVLSLSILLALLFVLPVISESMNNPLISFTDIFYRTGALVFGGGHVVLPMLEAELVEPGLISQSQFLSGYGAAQLVPGPMFSLSAFIGAVAPTVHPWIGGLLCLVAVYLPSFLLLSATLPFIHTLRQRPWLRNGLTAVNAAVVGLLAEAAYSHLFVHCASNLVDAGIAVAGLIAMFVFRVNLWIVAPLVVAYGIATN